MWEDGKVRVQFCVKCLAVQFEGDVKHEPADAVPDLQAHTYCDECLDAHQSTD